MSSAKESFPPSEDFGDTDRFVVHHQIGAGGMGVVIEVYDAHRNERLALKTMARVTPDAIYRL